jgi:hypothetical protein
VHEARGGMENRRMPEEERGLQKKTKCAAAGSFDQNRTPVASRDKTDFSKEKKKQNTTTVRN